jgi:hypothetical protein
MAVGWNSGFLKSCPASGRIISTRLRINSKFCTIVRIFAKDGCPMIKEIASLGGNWSAFVTAVWVMGFASTMPGPAVADTVYSCRGVRNNDTDNQAPSYLRILEYAWFHQRAAIVSDGFLFAATTITKADAATVYTYVRANAYDGVITVVPTNPGEADAILHETGRMMKLTESYHFSCNVVEISAPDHLLK